MSNANQNNIRVRGFYMGISKCHVCGADAKRYVTKEGNVKVCPNCGVVHVPHDIAVSEGKEREELALKRYNEAIEHERKTAVRNINSAFRIANEFTSVSMMAATIESKYGYDAIPEDGLKEGRDYEYINK